MKKRIVFLLKFLLSAGLITWLYSHVEVDDMLSIFRSIDYGVAPVIFALLLVNTVISSIKWRILLSADGIDVPLRTLVMSYLVGTFFNLFLPSSIGGDAYRIYDITTYSQHPANAFASVIADRFTGFVAMVALGALAALSAHILLPDKSVLLPVLLAFTGILMLIWALTRERLLRWGMAVTHMGRVARIQGFFDRFMASIQIYRRRPDVLIKVLGISVFFQVTNIVCVSLMARALHIEAPLLLFFVFVPLIDLLVALPISIYGLGVRDLSYVYFFGFAGVGETEALSMALFYVGLTGVYALSGAVIFVLRSRPGQDKSESHSL